MKKTFLGLLLLVAQLASAQSTVTFPPGGKIASENFVRQAVKAYVDSVLKVVTPPVVLPDPVPVPVENVPTLSPCDAGPELRTITNITENSLSANFHGNNVFGIDWHILDASGIVRMGSINPKSSTLSLTFQSLLPGKYRLKLFGNTCQGKTEMEFVIPIKETGSIDNTSGSFQVKGLLTYMGVGLLDPALITAGNAKPMLMIHGSEDNVLPYDSGKLFGCYLTSYGTKPVSQRLQLLNVKNQLLLQLGSGHVLSNSQEYIASAYASFVTEISGRSYPGVSDAQIIQKSGTYNSAGQNLRYEFFSAGGAEKRPLIFLMHEGAFLSGDLGNETGKARLLAQKGYSVAVINYRLGFAGATAVNPCGGTSLGVAQAIYRAAQDGKAALKYLTDRANEFGFDPQQIYLGGSSAGSIAVTAMTYMTDVDFERLVPGSTSPPDPSPLPILAPCDAGPEIRSISSIKGTELYTTFHGQNVLGIDWQIDGNGQSRTGHIDPKSSTLLLSYRLLPTGSYTLTLKGSTCNGQSSMPFEIKSTDIEIPPGPTETFPNSRLEARGNHELFMNLTGYGYNVDEPSGMSPEWVERIESFKFDWGWGITGIRLCVRWYEWEPTEGQYTRAGLQKVIEYCKARNLKLSVFFWPWRREGDGFIPSDHLVTGNRGKLHEVEGGTRMGSLASDPTNQKIYRAVFELSKQLSSYTGSYYVSIGTAAAEEFINPLINAGWPGTQIGGFEPVFQDGFKKFLAAKGRTYHVPEIGEWDRGAALQMSSETGKDFARYISLSLARYFSNFSKAVHEGSGNRLLACYMYPDAGTRANAWHLHANFAAQATTADAMYGTEGVSPWDNDMKRLCNAINIGMGKVSWVEWDAEDLGVDQTRRNCDPINQGHMQREFEQTYQAGADGISLAMSFCPEQIRSMEPSLKYLQKYLGKPVQKPAWPVTNVPLTPAFWKGETIYQPYWTGQNYLRPDDTDFWGSYGRN